MLSEDIWYEIAAVNLVNNPILMKIVCVLALIVALAVCDQLVPIQKTSYGFAIGDLNGKLQIDAFFDFQCKRWII